MLLKEIVVIVCIVGLTGCSIFKPKNGDDPDKKPAESVKEQLSKVMTDLKESETIFLEKTVPSGTKYLLLDKDQLSSGMDWLAYTLIEGITEKGEHSLAASSFKKKESQQAITLRLLNEEPVFSWSLDRGSNLSVEVAKVVGAKVSFEESYIYEFVISKVAEFVVDRSAFDETAFNKLITTLYVLSVENNKDPTLQGYETFKKAYGVSSGGVLYEIIVNEYKSTKVDGEADIPALVKTKAGFYKKTRSLAKMPILKLFFINAGYSDVASLKRVSKVTAALKSNDQRELIELLKTKPSSTPNTNAYKAFQELR